MRVRVRLFALQRQQLGRRELELELPVPSTIGQAWGVLVDEHPVLGAATSSVRFARNGSYAEPAETLRDGDEVAVIPPVAGGEEGRVAAKVAEARALPGSHAGRRILALSAAPLGDELLADLRRQVTTPDDGAVVCFVGQTRRTAGSPAPGQDGPLEHEGDVLELEYEAFESMAEGVLQAIADEIESRFGVNGLAIVHRTGTVAVGEASVAICAAAPHRSAAFEAARYAIEELKARAPIWKSERYADGAVWLGQPARKGPPEAPAADASSQRGP
jgi:molybdopterin synthase catalytic subunit